jgi:hypothetical protein
MSHPPRRPRSRTEFLATILNVYHNMPESRLAVLTNFIISMYILTLVYTGEVGGFVGVSGVVAINGVTSGLVYALGQALEEAEQRQQNP